MKNFFKNEEYSLNIYVIGCIIMIIILSLFSFLGCDSNANKFKHSYIVEATFNDNHKDTLSFRQDTTPQLIEYEKNKYGINTTESIISNISKIKILQMDNLSYYKLKIIYYNGRKDTIETFLKYVPLLECRMNAKNGFILKLDKKEIKNVLDFEEIK